MKRSPQHGNTRRQRHAQTARSSSYVSRVLGNAVFVLLGLSILGLIATLSLTRAQFPAGSAASHANSDTSAADTSVPADQGVWIAIRSTATADLIAAARQSSLFAENRSGSSDYVTDLSRLGTPVFVRPLRRVSSAHGNLPDFYVIPILNARGETTDAAELELNPAHTAIHVIAIVTYAQPHPLGAIPQLTPQAAATSLKAHHHVKLRSGAQAQLVYFPLDAELQQTGKLVWTSGGEFPADPVWLIPGADGQDHIVGDDGAVYLSSQIPSN